MQRDEISWKQLRVSYFLLLLMLLAMVAALLFPARRGADSLADLFGPVAILVLLGLGSLLKALGRWLSRGYFAANPQAEQTLKVWATIGLCISSVLVSAAVIAVSLKLNF